MSFFCFGLFLILYETFPRISAATHWVVTSNGRIQSEVESVYEMHRPYDLPAFLEKEARLNEFVEAHKRLLARKCILDERTALLNAKEDVESSLYRANANCENVVLGINEFDFYTSVALDGSQRKGIKPEDFLVDNVPKEGKNETPDCKETFSLDFSIFTFDHLDAMQSRKNLTQHEEPSLKSFMPSGMDLPRFGSQLAHVLKCNSKSWLHLNLAAIYWRIRGDAYNAVECARRAIVTAPREFRDIPLLTTGGILHAARYSDEAAIILHAALDHAPAETQQHLALGYVYATLGDYNRSSQCYDNSLKISPGLKQAEDAKDFITCAHQWEKLLADYLKTLEETLDELQQYQRDGRDLLTLREQILRDDSMQILLAKLGHERLDWFLAGNTRFETSESEAEEGRLSCQTVTHNQNLPVSPHGLLFVGVRHFQNYANQLETFVGRITKAEKSRTFRKLYSGNLKRSFKIKDASNEQKPPDISTFFIEPSRKSKYENFVVGNDKASFESDNWPHESECIDELSMPTGDTRQQYVSVHLPPENKGFATHLFVSELIRIDPGNEHPLPWYPPTCQTPESYDQKNIPPLLLISAGNNANSPESSLAPFLAGLVEGADLAEIGQRILTAIRARVAAPWVLSVLASLHWRIIGKPRNALDCLQEALSSVPEKFRDVPLVGIASIAQKLGFIDEALGTTKEALRTNSIEPATNFLYATLLHAKGNNSGAIHHLKESLRVEPEFMDGRAMRLLKTVICGQRMSPRRLDHVGVIDGMMCLSQEKVVQHGSYQGETVVCLEDGGDVCRPLHCFAITTSVDSQP